MQWWAAAAVAALVGGAGAFVTPRLQQCDPRWGNDTMGVPGPGEQSTICGEGCAMTSFTMALNALNISLPGLSGPVTPGTLNRFLQQTHLYHCMAGDCNNLVLNVSTVLGPELVLLGESPLPPFATMAAHLEDMSVMYLAHVHNGHHFVLLTGVADSQQQVFTANDPNYPTTTYAYMDIGDVIAYRVVPRSSFPTAWVAEKPLFKQCDPSWGANVMEHDTICQVGCLMSSTSMGLRANAILISGQPADPGTLNAWLRANGGYTDGDDLQESVVPNINASAIAWPADGMHVHNDLPLATVRSFVVQGRTVIANVMQGRHFVLVTGFGYQNPDLIFVNDPGFPVTNYSYTSDIVGWRIFDMADGWN